MDCIRRQAQTTRQRTYQIKDDLHVTWKEVFYKRNRPLFERLRQDSVLQDADISYFRHT